MLFGSACVTVWAFTPSRSCKSCSGPSGAPPPPEFNAQARLDAAAAAEHCGRTRHSRGLSKKLNGALQRAQSTRHPGRSASAEDLLERCEERPLVSQHLRSRSSPTGDKLIQVSNWDHVQDSSHTSGRCTARGRRDLDPQKPSLIGM